MRVRYKAWALPEIEASPYVSMDPAEHKHNWSKFFENPDLPLSVELGTGLGRFISEIAETRPEYNYLGIDIENLAVAHANRKITAKKLGNARLLRFDISKIGEYFAEDEVSEIFINFPNPWPKRRQKKRRLTHPRQLVQYRNFLKDGSEIWFKTDDTDLYEASLEYFPHMGFEILAHTDNLITEDKQDPRSIMTEYEERWRGKGIKIKAIQVKKLAGDNAEFEKIAMAYKDSPKAEEYY